MTQEQIENLQDAWFSCRDVHDETGNEEVKAIMDRLHVLIVQMLSITSTMSCMHCSQKSYPS